MHCDDMWDVNIDDNAVMRIGGTEKKVIEEKKSFFFSSTIKRLIGRRYIHVATNRSTKQSMLVCPEAERENKILHNMR